jgi:hypothetical protein
MLRIVKKRPFSGTTAATIESQASRPPSLVPADPHDAPEATAGACRNELSQSSIPSGAGRQARSWSSPLATDRTGAIHRSGGAVL